MKGILLKTIKFKNRKLRGILTIFILICFFLTITYTIVSGSTSGVHYYAGINIASLNYDGIQATISYANPTLATTHDFSGEWIGLGADSSNWVQGGWMKDANFGMSQPLAYLENVVNGNRSVYFYSISPSSHNYKLEFVGRRADYMAVFRLYIDGQVANPAGIVYAQYLMPEATGEVFNNSSSYSQMGPASLSNIQLRYANQYVLWKDQYPTQNTQAFQYPPYQLLIFNKYYNIGNRLQP